MVTVPASPSKLKFFADFIEAELGIVYSESNFFQLERRLQEIAGQFGHASVDELYETVQPRITGPVKELLLDIATNNETSFFRDPNTFQALEQAIVPQIRTEFPERRALRIWSAAASTGQEAYSIVMTLEQMRTKDPGMPDYTILGTDVSERVLKRASEGAYSQLEVQRGLGARQLVSFFEKRPDGLWQIKLEHKRKVQFRHNNLLGAWTGLPKFDIIFCRNVLIYQSLENKAKVVRKLHDHLTPGGILILGGTESLLGFSHEFVT